MASQEKVTVYNVAGAQEPTYTTSLLQAATHANRQAATDLKNTSDDTIPVYLNSLKFRQSHRLTDVRLALGYSALILAAACFGWDYKLGFDNTKYYTAAAVVIYGCLNSALTLWIWKKEKGVVYVGTAPSGETVSIAPPLSPCYRQPERQTTDKAFLPHR